MKKSKLRFTHTIQEEIDKTLNINKKYFNYLRSIIDRLDFQVDVKSIRQKNKIPITGFSYEAHSYKIKKDTFIGQPDNLVKNFDYRKDIDQLVEKYKIDALWFGLIKNYVTFNTLDRNRSSTVVTVADIYRLINEKSGMFLNSTDTHILEMNFLSREYPIAIMFGPHISQRDLIDCVKKLYKISIKPLQEKYCDKSMDVLKVKKRNNFIRERNNFIYNKQHLPRKDIMKLLTDKYGADRTIDYAYIGKIISMKNKRKDV